jgi:transposase
MLDNPLQVFVDRMLDRAVAENPGVEFTITMSSANSLLLALHARRASASAAAQNGQGGAYLRQHGLYSSLISEWRRFRDAGVLAGKEPGEKVGKLTAEQAEIARLRRQLDKAERRLVTTEAALVIMGKAHDLLDVLTKSSRDDSEHTTH